MRRLVTLFVVLPLTIIIVFLSVANREPVSFALYPSSTAVTVEAPLFVFLFAALALGVVFGGIATWLGQKKWRRAARTERSNAGHLRREVADLRAGATASAPALPGPRRDAA